jgi:hypothetical protein
MAGGIVGGVLGALYTTRLFASGMLLLKQGGLYNAQDRAWRAYVSCNPQVAQWRSYKGQTICCITQTETEK